jgi:hypothetical protein
MESESIFARLREGMNPFSDNVNHFFYSLWKIDLESIARIPPILGAFSHWGSLNWTAMAVSNSAGGAREGIRRLEAGAAG